MYAMVAAAHHVHATRARWLTDRRPSGASPFELRPDVAPQSPLAGAGLLYQGPHGPARVSADPQTGGLQVHGPAHVVIAMPLVHAHRAIACGGLALSADDRTLLARHVGGRRSRRGRAIAVLDGERELARFRLRGLASVSMEDEDGAVLGTLPWHRTGTGSLCAIAQPLHVGLLIAFCASSLAIELRWDAHHSQAPIRRS
jgi:hypothetical protein